ncbi:MAG: hypothetical protein ACKOQ5_01290, partial [Solirubrobacterales bacterium]
MGFEALALDFRRRIGHAREEADHVGIWDQFVDAVGGEVTAEPNPETVECVEAWTRADGFGPQLARLFAVESGQPEISKTKSKGLSEFYGIEDAPAREYFTVHASTHSTVSGLGSAVTSPPTASTNWSQIPTWSASSRAW